MEHTELSVEYTELTTYDVPPGVVSTWTPFDLADQWQDDDRPLSCDHEAHLAEGETGSWIGSVLQVPVAYDEDALRRALIAWIARHEALRTTVVPAESATGTAAEQAGWQRRTLPANAIGVAPTEIGWLGAGHSLRYIEDFFATVSPYRWPHLLFATVVDPDRDSFVLAFGADHSVMDAYSQLLWFEEIVTLYQRALAGHGDDEMAELEVGSHVDFSVQDRAAAAALTAESRPVQRWAEWLGEERRFPHFPVEGVELAPKTGLPQTSISLPLTGRVAAQRLNDVCRELGTSAQSGVLAAISATFQDVWGIDRLRYVLPMHTRYQPTDAIAVGWYVGLCPVDLDVSGLSGARELITRAHDVVNADKELVRSPYPRVAELVDAQDGPRFVISYVDTRYVPGAEHWAEWHARALRSTSYSDDEVYFWFIRNREGFSVSSRYPATLGAERSVRALVAGVAHYIEAFGHAEALSGVAATGAETVA